MPQFFSSPSVSVLAGTGIFVLFIFFNIILPDMNLAVIILFKAIAYIVASIKSLSGVNG